MAQARRSYVPEAERSEKTSEKRAIEVYRNRPEKFLGTFLCETPGDRQARVRRSLDRIARENRELIELLAKQRLRFANVDFLKVADVEAAHEDGLRIAGGLAGVRDPNALASAVGRPQHTWDGVPLHRTLATMAVVYMIGIAQNQPFVEGNKRAGAISALLFLELNGIVHNLDPMRWVDALERVANGTLDLDGAVALLVAELGRDIPVEA